MNRLVVFVVVAVLVSNGGAFVQADSFGSGENTFKIEFVVIGDAGNVADITGAPNPAGAVSYDYRIGKYEISEQMIHKANAQSALEGSALSITLDTRGPDKPATSVSWFEAARFVNWLNISKDASPAYKFDDQGEFQLWEPGDIGFDQANRFRNTEAKYYIPNIDEWYKAAFFDPALNQYFDYPTGSNIVPTPVAFGTESGTAVWNQIEGPSDIHMAGGMSPYGTSAQGGNVFEWLETPLTGLSNEIPNPDIRALRGDEWGLAATGTGMASFTSGVERATSLKSPSIGFRIAATIPEPAECTMLLGIVACSTLFRVRYALRRLG